MEVPAGTPEIPAGTLEIPVGTLPQAVAAARRSSSHPTPRTIVGIFTSQRSPSLRPIEISRAGRPGRAAPDARDQLREVCARPPAISTGLLDLHREDDHC